MKKLLLVAGGSTPRAVREHVTRYGVNNWVYCGQDYGRLLEFEKQLGTVATRISTARELQRTVGDLRESYTDTIGRLGRKFASLEWWASGISEKNVMVSNLFLEICFVNLAIGLLGKADAGICVVAENPVVLEILQREARMMGYETRWVGRSGGLWNIFVAIRRIVGGCGRLLMQGFRSYCTGKRGSYPGLPSWAYDDDAENVFIHTLVDGGCFGKDGRFHDRYYGQLVQWLVEQGKRVIIIPELSNVTRSPDEVASFFRSNNTDRLFFLLNREGYGRLEDCFVSLWTRMMQLRWKFRQIVIGGIDVSALFVFHNQGESFSDGLRNCNLIRRLRCAGVRISRFIDTFEYMVPERLVQYGLIRHYPNARRIGYLHFAVCPNLLCLFPSREEFAFMPLPDVIVCNGDLAYSVLKAHGYPEKMLRSGPAFRYVALRSLPTGTQESQPRGEVRRVLVPLPLDCNAARELYMKVWGAAATRTDMMVPIKPHPFMSKDILEAIIAERRMPSHFQFVTGPMDEIVAGVDAGVVMGSSSALDLFGRGIPVVRVACEVSIELDSLGWYDDLAWHAFTAAEITAHLDRILTLDGQARARLAERGRGVVHQFFNPVTGETLRVFDT